MDAIEYLKQKTRMTKGCIIECINCPFTYAENGNYCGNLEQNDPQKAVEIVERWAGEHPIKTRKSEFMKAYPYVKLDSNICPDIRPCTINKDLFFNTECCESDDCDLCKEKFWLEEIK